MSKLLENVVGEFAKLPGVGRRTALRLALHLLKQDVEDVDLFAGAIYQFRRDIRWCKQCRNLSDEELCPICSDPKRDHSTICVVENVRDVMRIEETGQYHGVYHVLGGIISPINGIGPSDITVRELVERLRQAGGPVEVIFALSGSVEGETTAFYIYRQIEGLGVKVSTLARGLSFGADLEYADSLTLGRSIIDRQIFKP